MSGLAASAMAVPPVLLACRLYGILDLGYIAAADALPVARQMIAGGVDILQVRAKELAPEAILALVREIAALARAAAGSGKLVGRSTHSLAQARAARAEGADYLGFGPLFATPTKPDYPAIGLEDIAQAHAEVPDRPIFCIGGIKLENLAEVIAAGARRVVIVSGILLAPDVAAYTRQAADFLREAAD
jgi:thiamine-phosphate pyrophosphorylase